VDRPRPGAKLKLDERSRARLIAEACSTPGDERARWTLKRKASAPPGSPTEQFGVTRPCAMATANRSGY
jgi:hypothetical protein